MNRLITILLFCFNLTDGLCGLSEYIDIKEYTVNLYDDARNRVIPVAVYCKDDSKDQKVVIFSHGYGQNKGGDYLYYSHINRELAKQNYFVISIQHELPSDELLAMEGNLYEARMPNWERGVENILFVFHEFGKMKPELNWKHVSLVGHSNGGDTVMLFASKYPRYIANAISLDNRRMPLPRTNTPKVFSIRAFDYPADEGVIPSPEEQEKFKIQIIQLNNVKHSEMDNDASEAQSVEINGYLLNFLKN